MGQVPFWVGYPWLSAEKRGVENGLWSRGGVNGLAQLSVWHPYKLVSVQSPITHYLRTQYQSNPRFSFHSLSVISVYQLFYCMITTWPEGRHFLTPPLRKIISRNWNPLSVLLIWHANWNHSCHSNEVFVPDHCPKVIQIMSPPFLKSHSNFQLHPK